MIVSFQLEIKPRRETEEVPRVISDDILKSLCKSTVTRLVQVY